MVQSSLEVWQSDLAVVKLGKMVSNKYICVCTDLFNMKVYARIMDQKTSAACKVALQSIFSESIRPPVKLETDQ